MTEPADLSAMLEAERKRLKREPREKTPEQRKRERLARAWWRNLQHIWHKAHLLDDAELEWLAHVIAETRDKPARVSHNPFTGRNVITRPPTSHADAAKLEQLEHALWGREADEAFRQRQQRRRDLAKRLASFGLKADQYADLDNWSEIDRYREKRDDDGGAP